MNVLEIMALPEVRRAGEAGCAVALLTPALDDVIWLNEAAEQILAPGPVARAALARLAAFHPALLREGEVTTRLAAAPGGGAGAHATLKLALAVTAEGTEAALLISLHSLARPERGAVLAERLLREARILDQPALMADADGIGAMTHLLTQARAAEFADAAAEFLDGPVDYLEIVDEGDRIAFARVAAGLALVTLLPGAGASPASPASQAPADDAPDDTAAGNELAMAPRQDTPPTQGAADVPSPIGQIVQRWHERLGDRAVTLRSKAAETRDRMRTAQAGMSEPRQPAPPPPDSRSEDPHRFVWRVDANFRFTELSPQLEHIVGATAQDLIGRSIFDVFASLGLDGDGAIAAALRARQTWSGRRVAWPLADSTRAVTVELAALPVYGRGAIFDGARGFGTIGPIVEQDGLAKEPAQAPTFEAGPTPSGLNHAEADAFASIGASLRNAPEAAPMAEPALPSELAQLLDALPLATLVQARGRLVHANRSFLDLSLFDDLAALERAGGIELLTAEPLDAADGVSAIRLRRADASHVRVTCQMQRIQSGGRSLLVFTFQRPAPATSDDETLELRAVLNTATDGILLLAEDGTLRGMNGSAEALFGLSAHECRGYPFTDLLAEESRDTAAAYLATLRDGGMQGLLNDGREVLGKVARGKPIPLFITVGRLGVGRGWCVVIRDIGHWKRVEEDLLAARRQAEDASILKSRFLTNISHELRTPLNAIIGFADVMASESFGPIGNERYVQYLRDIKRSGHHLLDLVNDLLDISKIEAGKAELDVRAVALGTILSETVGLMQPQASRARVILRSDLPPSLPCVLADARSIRQIALNLLSNAIRFTPPGGQVVVSLSAGPDGDVILRFRDTGIGMNEDEIEEAMAPYQQVGAITRKQGDGTGLGLPLTKAMVEANAARFQLRSTPGEGTLVEITFPAARIQAP